MSDMLDSLTEEQVRRISVLIEALDKSSLDFLRLELGDLTLTIGKGDVPPPGASASPAPTDIPVAATALSPAAEEDVSAPEDTVPIAAPMMGRFYASPEPGAPPFVSLGATIEAGGTVGLIEVMKLFTSIQADVSGTIVEVCVKDAEFIEYEQVLFRVKPQSARG